MYNENAFIFHIFHLGVYNTILYVDALQRNGYIPHIVLAGMTETPDAIGKTAGLLGPPMARRLVDCRVMAYTEMTNCFFIILKN